MIRRPVPLLLAILLSAGAAISWAKPATASGQGHRPCRVAIDVGHDAKHPGAISARGKGEFSFNLAMARTLRNLLAERPRVYPFIHNENGAPVDGHDRAIQAARRNADVLVSIHHDSVNARYFSTWQFGGRARPFSDRFRGHSIFVSNRPPTGNDSLALAEAIGRQLVAAGFRPSLHHAENIPGERRALIDKELGVFDFPGLKILRRSTVAAVLIECGVIVNRGEEVDLSDPVYRRRMAAAIAEGIVEICHSPGE